MTMACPKCHQPVRSGARFCAHCGATTTSPPQPNLPVQVDTVERMRQAVLQAGASTAPVVKDAAAKGWQASRREMGRVRRYPDPRWAGRLYRSDQPAAGR